tara:strand:+ start:2678 stop:3670 length:993 start_codon:yes stop_codon:yes gene_type:complete
MLIRYNSCVYCKSKSLELQKKQNTQENFYTKAIFSDLNLSKKLQNKIKVYKCKKCHVIQNSPWFDKIACRRIYSNVYGQHNRGWENLLNFASKGVKPDHGILFDLLKKKIKIKKYAEYNSPFMGLMLNFFFEEIKIKKKLDKNFYDLIFTYLNSRQVAGLSKYLKTKKTNLATKTKKKISFLKKKSLRRKKTEKIIFIDNSPMCWGINDNHKSVNSKTYATELMDMNIFNLDDYDKNRKIDLFGIFHTLDHTFEPSKILNFALDVSKYVIVYCHVNPVISKQHLFSITRNFLKYLRTKKISTVDLTFKIKKNFKSPELYFLCSRKKMSNF